MKGSTGQGAPGNAIEANLNDGVLSLSVRSKGPADIRRSGTELLNDVFAHFGDENIQEFAATWVSRPQYNTNYLQYRENLAKNMSPQAAAWATWTGQQMKARGFTRAEVTNDSGEQVNVRFYR
jgi:hypothetical protein